MVRHFKSCFTVFSSTKVLILKFASQCWITYHSFLRLASHFLPSFMVIFWFFHHMHFSLLYCFSQLNLKFTLFYVRYVCPCISIFFCSSICYVLFFLCLSFKIASFEVSRVETQDGGDAKVEVSPRDIIYSQPAEALEGEQPVILHKLDLRYGYGYKFLDPFLKRFILF